MTGRMALLAAAALALAACAQDNDMSSPYPSGGGAAGAQGEGYCEAPPANVSDTEAWQKQCMPNRG